MTTIAELVVSLVPELVGGESGLEADLEKAASKAADGSGVTKAGKKAGSAFSGGMKSGMSGLATAAAGVISVGTVATVGKALYDIGSEFDEVSDTIRTKTGATGDALIGLVDVAKSVGSDVPASFEEIGPAVASVNQRLGLTGDTLKTVSEQYLEAGRVLGETVDVNKTSAAFSAFGISGDAVSGSLDELFRVSQATGVGMNDLASKVKAAAPAAKILGLNFDQTASMIGALDKAGLDAGRMTGSLSKAVTSLAKDGEKPADAFKRVTGQIQEYAKEGKTTAAINLASKLFGTKNASAFVDALKSGKLNMDDLTGSIGAGSDTILGVADDTADFAENWQEVQNNAKLALEPLGSAVFGALGDALKGMMPALKGLAGWLSQNPAALGVVAGIIGVTLVAAFFAWAGSVWAANAALLANPITWIILGIIALIAGIVLLAMNWDKVAAWISTTWGAFVTWLGGTWTTISGTMQAAWDGIVAWLTGIWTGISTTATGIWNGLVAFFIQWGPWVLAALTGPVGLLVRFLADNWGKVSSGAKTIWNGLVSWIGGIPGRIMATLGGLGSLLVSSGKSLVSGFLSGIKGAWSTLVGWVKKGMVTLRGLWPFSPAKWGPFSGHGYVTYSGQAITGDFADSIRGGMTDVQSAGVDLMDAATVPSLGFNAQSALPTETATATSASDKGLTVQITNPVPEKASESLSRVYAKAAYLGLDGLGDLAVAV